MFFDMKIRIPNEHLYMKLMTAIDEADSIPPCQTTDPEIWYSEKGDVGFNYRMAKEFCGQCPVMNECGKYAMEANEPDGIWGGLTPKQRQQMRAARDRANRKYQWTR